MAKKGRYKSGRTDLEMCGNTEKSWRGEKHYIEDEAHCTMRSLMEGKFRR